MNFLTSTKTPVYLLPFIFMLHISASSVKVYDKVQQFSASETSNDEAPTVTRYPSPNQKQHVSSI